MYINIFLYLFVGLTFAIDINIRDPGWKNFSITAIVLLAWPVMALIGFVVLLRLKIIDLIRAIR